MWLHSVPWQSRVFLLWWDYIWACFFGQNGGTRNTNSNYLPSENATELKKEKDKIVPRSHCLDLDPDAWIRNRLLCSAGLTREETRAAQSHGHCRGWTPMPRWTWNCCMFILWHELLCITLYMFLSLWRCERMWCVVLALSVLTHQCLLTRLETVTS